MKPSLFTIKLAGASALLAFAVTGCMRPDRDRFNSEGMNVLLKQEDENMGEVLNTNSTVAAKTGAVMPDTFSGELNVTWTHDAVNGLWIRSAEYTGTNGFERQRQDTIILTDSLGYRMSEFRPALAAAITHARHIIKTRNGKQVDIHINTTFAWSKDANGTRIAGIWNGTITGTFNNFLFKIGSIHDVTRPFTPAGPRMFGFPTSGYIEVERLVYRVKLEFLGSDSYGSSADVTVTNTNNGTTYILHINTRNVETQQ